MENYKVTLNLEPTDRYEKAKKALLEMKKAMSELTPQQQEQLIRELIDTEALLIAYEMLKKYFGCGEKG